MAPSKTQNETFQDTVIAELALKAHFYISDTYPKDTSALELAKLMLQHNPQASEGTPSWQGEHFEACKRFEKKHAR